MIDPIEAEIQEEILDALPGDYNSAIEIMAQLTANILLSGKTFDIDFFISKLRCYHAAYKADDEVK